MPKSKQKAGGVHGVSFFFFFFFFCFFFFFFHPTASPCPWQHLEARAV
jgi:hypothetical protein